MHSPCQVGNETCLVNDPVIDPMNRETYSSEMGNCSVIIFRVGPWYVQPRPLLSPLCTSISTICC